MAGRRAARGDHTRARLLSAAAAFLDRGAAAPLAAVARRAGVSRATAYRYFDSPEALAREAALQDAVVAEVERRLSPPSLAGPPRRRLDALVEAVLEVTHEHEQAFRAYLRAKLAPLDGADGRGRRTSRPANRVRWIEQILAGTALTGRPRERLVAALSLLLGIETVIVLGDVCGLGAAERVRVARWAARVLLDAAMVEAHSGRRSARATLA